MLRLKPCQVAIWNCHPETLKNVSYIHRKSIWNIVDITMRFHVFFKRRVCPQISAYFRLESVLHHKIGLGVYKQLDPSCTHDVFVVGDAREPHNEMDIQYVSGVLA